MTELELRAQKIIADKERTKEEKAKEEAEALSQELLRLKDEFKKGDKSLKMDFSSAEKYRLCFVPKKDFGTIIPMIFGKWEMDAFIVWIYEELMVQKLEEVAA